MTKNKKMSQAEMKALEDLTQSGSIAPVIDRSSPLKNIVEAFKYAESGRKAGNVAVRIVEI